MAQVLQYHLLARLSDLLKIRALDCEECMLDQRPAIAVNFRTSKCDPSYKGATSYLVKVEGDSDFCAYTILKYYFLSCGFKFKNSKIQDRSFLFCRSQHIGSGHARYAFFMSFV